MCENREKNMLKHKSNLLLVNTKNRKQKKNPVWPTQRVCECDGHVVRLVARLKCNLKERESKNLIRCTCQTKCVLNDEIPGSRYEFLSLFLAQLCAAPVILPLHRIHRWLTCHFVHPHFFPIAKIAKKRYKLIDFRQNGASFDRSKFFSNKTERVNGRDNEKLTRDKKYDNDKMNWRIFHR